jgi:hypothetical protein
MTITFEQFQEIPRDQLLELLDKAKQKLKSNQSMQELFEEHGLEINDLDLIPMCFADLDVSARTEKGVISLNYQLVEDGSLEEDLHYLPHEIVHYLQQTTGKEPTEGSGDDDYLDNEFEQEAFKFQSKFISETEGDEEAEAYISKVLEHHEVPSKDIKKRRKQLLELASAVFVNKIARKN